MLDLAYTVIARDVHRDILLKAVMRSMGCDSSKVDFSNSFPAARYHVEEARPTTDFEMRQEFDDGSTLAELVQLAEWGTVVYATDVT